MEKIMNRQSQVQARPDLDRDGFLVISKASTLARYRELRKETTDVIGKYNLAIFFAFNDEQFRTGYRGLVSRGLISEGDKVCSCLGGGYGTREAWNRYFEIQRELNKKMAAECDPYEVYLEEYNNHECSIDWDGDERAVEAVLRIYGLERTMEALTGRRKNACGTIRGIFDNITK